MTKHKTISILIPVCDEEEVFDEFYQRLDQLTKEVSRYTFEFLFINDGSRDRTLEMIKSYAEKDGRIAYVNLSRNFGKEIAMAAGIDYVTGDATVIIDADLQDPPELIPQMINYWEEGYADVYARRTSRAGESWLKKATSEAFYKILQKSTTIPIQRDTGDFRLLDKRCIEALRNFRESQRYTKGMFSWIGYRKKEILYDRKPRLAGVTKWNYRKLVNFAIDGITSFTTAPLRFSSLMGVIISFAAFIYIIYIVVRTILFGPDQAGYPSMMAAILFLGGVQLLSIGIIGEYVGRIFNETKHRPLYFIEEYHEAPKSSKK